MSTTIQDISNVSERKQLKSIKVNKTVIEKNNKNVKYVKQYVSLAESVGSIQINITGRRFFDLIVLESVKYYNNNLVRDSSVRRSIKSCVVTPMGILKYMYLDPTIVSDIYRILTGVRKTRDVGKFVIPPDDLHKVIFTTEEIPDELELLNSRYISDKLENLMIVVDNNDSSEYVIMNKKYNVVYTTSNFVTESVNTLCTVSYNGDRMLIY